MRTEGPDFLQRNAALGTEIRRTLTDIDGIEKELGKAAKAIDSATGLTAKYRIRLQGLCQSVTDRIVGFNPMIHFYFRISSRHICTQPPT